MNQHAITYVVTQNLDHARALRTRIAPWTRDGLVEPFVVLAREAVDVPGDPLGRWTHGDGNEVGCLDAVAERPYAVVRVVAYQAVRRGSSGDATVVKAAKLLHGRLRQRMAPSQKLISLNMIVPDDQARGLPRDLLDLHATANVVVAPEDRASPERASHVLADEGRLQAHGALHLCSLAGLWSHQASSPFDVEGHTTFGEIPHVTLARAFGRVVRAPALVERVARAVFEQRSTAAWATKAVDARVVGDADRVVSAQAAQLVARHSTVLEAPSAIQAERPPERTVGIWQAFVMMLQFTVSGLRDLPKTAIAMVDDSVRAAVASFAQDVVFGQNSMMRIRVPANARGGTTVDRASEVTDLAADLLRREGGGTATPPANGELWRDLRALSFALLDGGDFPQGLEPPRAGSEREIVSDPSAIAPDPDEGAFVPQVSGLGVGSTARSVISPCDLLQARFLAGELEAYTSEGEPAEGEAKKADRDSPVARPSDEQRQAAADELERLCVWTSRRERSLVGRLGIHLSNQIEEGQSVLARALERVKKGPPPGPAAAYAQERARLFRLWQIATAILLAAVAGVVLSDYLVSDTVLRPLASYGQLLVTALLVWLLAMFLAFLRFQRRMFQLDHQMELRRAEYDAAEQTAVKAARRLLVLLANYQQLREWGEIIGWLVHHPESELAEADDEAADVDMEMPSSHRIGYAVDGGEKDFRLAAKVGRRVFGRGWLAALYSDVEHTVMAELKHDQGLDARDPDPDPDWDVRSPSARSYLLDSIASRRPTEEWTRRRVSQVARILNEFQADELFSSVHDLVDREDRPAETFLYEPVQDFNRETGGSSTLGMQGWAPGARLEQADRVQSTSVWSTTPLGGRVVARDKAGEDALSVHVHAVESPAVAERATFEVVLVRTDRTAAVPVHHLAIFGAVPESVSAERFTGPSNPDVW